MNLEFYQIAFPGERVRVNVAALQSNGRLLRLLGVGFGIAVTIGGTVGVGILRTPGMVAAQLESYGPIVLVWILGGLYSLLGTVSVCELGTALPSAGGWYVYARRALGEYAGFVVGWSDWIAQSASLAYLATALGEFTVALVPALSGAHKAIATFTLALFAFLQWRGLRSSSRVQELTSLAKGLAFLAFVGICFVAAPPASEPKAASFDLFRVVPFVLALQAIIVTYDGWYSAIYFTEEDRDPGRNLPRSALGGVLATLVIYLLVNFALLHVLTVSEIAGSTLPAAAAAARIFGGRGGDVITLLSLISLFSILNAVLLLATRIAFAMSRDRLFFGAASMVNPRGTPTFALLFTTLCAVVLVASGTFERLVAIAAFFFVVVYVSGFVSLFVLRRREPGLPRPFRAWGYPWTTGVALAGSLLFLVGNGVSDPENTLYAVSLIALSYPLYRFLRSRRPGEMPVAFRRRGL
jgi:APA family basic amino acid/polyamine antiporter